MGEPERPRNKIKTKLRNIKKILSLVLVLLSANLTVEPSKHKIVNRKKANEKKNFSVVEKDFI